MQELGRRPTDAEIAQRCEVDEQEIEEARLSAAGYRPVSLCLPVGDGGDELGDLIGSADPAIDLVSDQITVAGLVQMLPGRERRILRLRFYGDLTPGGDRREARHVADARLAAARPHAVLAARGDVEYPAALAGRRVGTGRPARRRHQLLATGTLRVRVTGEVDRDNAVQLRDALLRAVRRTSGRGRITVDLSRVPLLDAAGVGVLVAVREAARARDVAVTVTGLQPFVRRVGQISGLSAMLEPDPRGPHPAR